MRPGTSPASAHCPQLIATGGSIPLAASTATGFPAIAVMNIAEVTVLTSTRDIIRYAPNRLRDSSVSGVEPSRSDSDFTIG